MELSNPESIALSGARAGQPSTFASLIEIIRPAHWVKNAFVLAPLVFSRKLLDPRSELQAAVAALAFCFAASAVYIWNDILDRTSDQMHPGKCTRPIPSGRLSVRTAGALGVVLLTVSLLLSFAANVPTGMLLSAYLAINVVYSLWLKHAVVLDLMCVSLGFVLRVSAGAAVISVEASHWLLMCTFLLALTLSIFRRREEAIALGDHSVKHRSVLGDYSAAWFDQAGTMLSAATIVAYALYTVAPETQARFGTDRLFYTLPFVVFGVLRYLHLVHKGERTGNPSAVLIEDRPLLWCVLAWIASCALIIYTR